MNCVARVGNWLITAQPLPSEFDKPMPKILLFANTDWYLYNFRRSLAARLRTEGWEVVLISPPGEYGPKLTALGFRWIPCDFAPGGTNPLAEIGVLRRLIALYRTERPDLVHHFTIKCVLYGSLAARLAGGIPVVNAVTGLGHIFTDSGRKATLLRPLVKGLYRFVLGAARSRVIFQNDEDRNFFATTGLVDAERTRLIRGSGVDCALFSPTVHIAAPDSSPLKILFASRLLREKGIVELLAAARILRKNGVDAEFLLAGGLYPGNPSSLSENEMAAIQEEGIVSCLGHVDDMLPLLAAADIVVLPSYREGTPRILIEAAAMGIPIVATDIAGCRGLVQDGVNGFLVPVKDATALATALQRLTADQALRQVMGAAGRAIVLAEFDEEIVLEKTLAVYRELL